MKMVEEVINPFLDNLVEFYRFRITQNEKGKELANQQRELGDKLWVLIGNCSEEQREQLECYITSIMDLSSYEQQELYMQGVKDGIHIMKIIGTL